MADLQQQVDDFIAATQDMTGKAIAFIGEPHPDDIARGNIRRMRMAAASLQAALDQANTWAMQSATLPQPTASPVGAKR